MKVRIKSLPLAKKGGLSDFLSNSRDYKNAVSYGANRKVLAQKMGIDNYGGTAEQNVLLLNRLQGTQSKTMSVKSPIRKSPVDISQRPVSSTVEPTAATWGRRGGKPANADASGLAVFNSRNTNRPWITSVSKPKPKPISKVADNSHLPQNLMPYFNRQADANKGRVMFTDKGTKKTFYGTRDNTGKFNLNNFDVLTAKNDKPEDSDGKYTHTFMAQQDAEGSKGNFKNFVTPSGSFKANVKPDIYGSPGISMGDTQIAVHKTYPGELATRSKNLKDGNPKNNNVSWGCINGNCADVQKLVNFTQPGDSMFIGDSRLPINTNMKSFATNHKFGGETKYQNGGPLSNFITKNQSKCPKGVDCTGGGYTQDVISDGEYRQNMEEGQMNLYKQRMGIWGATEFQKNNQFDHSFDPQTSHLSYDQYMSSNIPPPVIKGVNYNPTDYAKFGGAIQKNSLDRGFYNGAKREDEGMNLNDFIGSSDRKHANVEAEFGETALADMDGDGNLEHMKIGGQRHSNGGTPLELPKGAFIFSDTPKMKIGGELLAEFGKSATTKKKYTPAQLAKQYDLNFYKEKAEDKDNDKFARDTAELMYENNKKKLGGLAFVQEAMKGFPTGVPGVSQQIMQEDQPDGQQEPMMRFGGSLPTMQKGGGYNPWKGDKYENKKNASKYSAAEIDSKARALGYDGTNDNLSLQTWIQNQDGLSNERVDELHKKYQPKPHGGKLDGLWGYRWDTALDAMRPKVPYNPELIRPTPQPGGVINPNYVPNITGTTPEDKPVTDLKTGDFNPTTGQPYTNINPNAWDVMGLGSAMTRPIDHIRPQLLRADAQVSDPTFMDNRATIQQIQSMGNAANDVVQNTSNGQVARANSMGNFGKMFDAVNGSNEQTQNANIQIENQFKSQRDATVNNNTITNLGALSKFIEQNDMYRANLSKEKQLKKTDITQQGQNMTNNMITLGSLLERTPNMGVSGAFWNNIKFKPGAKTNMFAGNHQDGSYDVETLSAEYQKLFGGPKPTPDQLMKYLQYKKGRTTSTYDGDNSTPTETEYRQGK